MHTLVNKRAAMRFSFLLMAAFGPMLTACGGGGSTTSPPPPPANSAPTFTGATDFTFQEGQVVQFGLTVNDADGDAITISDDSTGDGAFFTVDITNGNVTANTPDQSFDFETPQDVNGDNVYEQNITLSDGTASTTATITVTITDVDEPPQCAPLLVTNFEENYSGLLFEFANASADPEGASPTSYALDGVGRTTNVTLETLDKFVLDAATGELSLSEGLDAEFEGVDGEYIVTVSTTYGSDVVQCQQNFQIVDVPGIVQSGVKIEGKQIATRSAGDIDGDGLTDFWINATAINDDAPVQPFGYIIYGKTVDTELALDGAEILDIETLDVNQVLKLTANFPIDTGNPGTANTFSVAPMGDVDGDGFDELAIAVESIPGTGDEFDSNIPYAFIIWGSALSTQTNGIFDVSALTMNEGTAFTRGGGLNRFGMLVTSGDFDADGVNGLVISAPFAEIDVSANAFESGQTYIIFSKTLVANKSETTFDLESLTPQQGVRLTTQNDSGYIGADLSSLPDIDGDSFDELLTDYGSGVVVVFGSMIDAASKDTGTLYSGDINDEVTYINGNSDILLSALPGDADGDGVSDVLLSFSGQQQEGFAAIVYGDGISNPSTDRRIDLRPTNTLDDIVLFVDKADSFPGIRSKVSFMGDLDGDGLDDVALGFQGNDDVVGGVYIVLAKAFDNIGADNTFDVSSLNPGNGIRISDGPATFFDYDFAILPDSDGDSISEIFISGSQDDTEGYLMPGADILAALTSGQTELDLQDVFNDETAP